MGHSCHRRGKPQPFVSDGLCFPLHVERRGGAGFPLHGAEGHGFPFHQEKGWDIPLFNVGHGQESCI